MEAEQQQRGGAHALGRGALRAGAFPPGDGGDRAHLAGGVQARDGAADQPEEARRAVVSGQRAHVAGVPVPRRGEGQQVFLGGRRVLPPGRRRGAGERDVQGACLRPPSRAPPRRVAPGAGESLGLPRCTTCWVGPVAHPGFARRRMSTLASRPAARPPDRCRRPIAAI